MVRLTVTLAICFFYVFRATAFPEIDNHTLRPCEGFDCDDKYEPVCVYDKIQNCYLTVQNICQVTRLWCDYGQLPIQQLHGACNKDLPACDSSKYVIKPSQ